MSLVRHSVSLDINLSIIRIWIYSNCCTLKNTRNQSSLPDPLPCLVSFFHKALSPNALRCHETSHIIFFVSFATYMTTMFNRTWITTSLLVFFYDPLIIIINTIFTLHSHSTLSSGAVKRMVCAILRSYLRTELSPQKLNR